MDTESAVRMTNVVLVDDHLLFRDALRALLREQGDFAVVGEAGDATSACGVVEATSPDVAIVDVGLPDHDGIVVVRELRRRAPVCRVLILTAGTSDRVDEAYQAGAAGYALKVEPAQSIIDAIRAVARGDSYFPRMVAATSSIDALSHREHEIFGLAISGCSNQEIGDALHICVKTVETHRASINRKLNVHSPADLVRYALAHHILH